jgi:hypothetical protein
MKSKLNAFLHPLCWAMALLILALQSAIAGDDVATASIDVQGMGWWQNRKLEQSLDLLLRKNSPILDTYAIEDAAVILLSAVKDQGY